MSEFKELFSKKPQEEEKVEKSSFSVNKKSITRAKPMREKAMGVHTGEIRTSGKPLTKEEKKEQRRIRSEREDRILAVSNILMKENPTHQTLRKVWWGGLIVGLVMVVISWLTLNVAKDNPESLIGQLSIPTLVLAYIAIFGAFILDLIKIRPIRNEANKKAASMSAKKADELIAKYEESKGKK